MESPGDDQAAGITNTTTPLSTGGWVAIFIIAVVVGISIGAALYHRKRLKEYFVRRFANNGQTVPTQESLEDGQSNEANIVC